MLTFNRYINKTEIVKKLISIRCKKAERVNQKMTLRNTVKNGPPQVIRINDEDEFVYSIFPPRKEWCHLGKAERLKVSIKDRISKCLWLTYLHANNEIIKPKWLLKLNNYCDYLMNLAKSNAPFSKPSVFAIEKKVTKKDIICRPVCNFQLDSRILLSLFNRFLTKLFDGYFYKRSYAFRLSKPGAEFKFQHFNAINDIRNFRQSEKGPFFVAECDLKKFYDTIDHNVIKKRFCVMLRLAIKDEKIENKDAKILKKWFWCYLDNYSFFQDVYSLNKQQSNRVWSPIKKKGNKKFEWIQDELKEKLTNINNGSKRGINRTLRNLKIGVPQGGAISGFIANLMMHFVDKKLEQFNKKEKDFRYIRFCDDMIMIGRYKDDVVRAFDVYKQTVSRSHLFAHDDKEQNQKTMRDFWDGKSRRTYEWNSPRRGVFPWITFVGFDVNWKGYLRIRRRSYRKEIKKQYEKFEELENLVMRNIPKYGKESLERFTQRRLVGMSVGSVNMWNFKSFENDYSWLSAFSILDKNPWSSRQLRGLDKHRSSIVLRTKKMLNLVNYQGVAHKTMPREDLKDKENIYYGKPFSYYGQCLDYKSLK